MVKLHQTQDFCFHHISGLKSDSCIHYWKHWCEFIKAKWLYAICLAMLILLCQMFHPNNFCTIKGSSEDVAVINYFFWEGLESSDGAPCVVITLGYSSFIIPWYPLLIYCLTNGLQRGDLLMILIHSTYSSTWIILYVPSHCELLTAKKTNRAAGLIHKELINI